MDMTIKVDIVKRETIKPSSPTPPELRHFKLSLFDQFYPIFYVPLILFYDGSDTDEATSEKSRRLTASLSEVLARFYPLAGRMVDNLSLECADQGVEYLEAAVNCDLSRVLKKPDVAVLRKFLPATAGTECADATGTPLVLVQANFFECGGLAIALCLTHKVADAATMCTFLNAWAGTAKGAITEALMPDFCTASMFPPLDSLANSFPSVVPAKEKCVPRRFLLEFSRVAALRKRIEGWGGPAPTAVEAASALIWKCSAAASRNNKTNNKTPAPRPSVLAPKVNLRRRFEPQLPSNLAGNLVGFFTARADEREMGVHVLAGRLRGAIKGYCERHVKRLQGGDACAAICEASKEFGELLKKCRVEDETGGFYTCTSWCKFPFYEADFGWGRPIWACTDSAESPNFFVLMDARDGGGIEVWLTLREEDMALVEQDPDLLEFASLNPDICW